MPAAEKEIVFAVFITSFIFLLLTALIILLVYNYFNVRRQKEKDILRAVFETQESERNRISEDLHDDIGAKLSVLKLQNELVLNDNSLDSAKATGEKSAMLIDNIIKDIRAIVRNQSAKYLLQNGLYNEINALCNLYMSVKKVDIKTELAELPYELCDEFRVALFRIFQELLHNSIKHSEADIINIKISVGENGINLYYADNGKGFQPSKNGMKGMGMENIAARVSIFNGELNKNDSGTSGSIFFIYFSAQFINATVSLSHH